MIFDVETEEDKYAYFSTDKTEEDIWRIINIDDKITLMYNQPINTNYSKMFVSNLDELKKALKEDTSAKMNYKTKYYIPSNGTDCKNASSFTQVYSLNPGSLTNLFLYDTGSGQVSDIQHIYTDSNFENFYTLGTVTYTNSGYCYRPNEITNLYERVIRKAMYAKPINNPRYFSENDIYIDLFDVNDKLDYISVYDFNEDNPFKNDLYNQINPDLKNSLQQSVQRNNIYHDFFQNNSNTENFSNKSYFRVLTNAEVNKNANHDMLLNYVLPMGINAPYHNIGNNINKIDLLYTKKKSTNLYSVISNYGKIESDNKYIVNAYYAAGISTRDTSTYYSTSYTGYNIKTYKYYPVIDLTNANLLTDYKTYSQSYKKNYPNCENSLGKKECPYLLKINNYYSDGTSDS